MEQTGADVLVSTEDGIAVITLNRPEARNALRDSTLTELAGAFSRVREDAGVHAVILTGAGDRAFCAGADLSGFASQTDPASLRASQHLFVDVFNAIRDVGKPVIAAVNGHALAGGFGLALACDLVIASDTAGFGTPEIRVGLWPMMIMSIITRNLSRKRAMELFLTGRRIDAQTALEWGIVNQVVPQAEVGERARSLAGELCGWSTLLIQMGRDAFYASEDMESKPGLEYLHDRLHALSQTEDFREGVRAFVEKRKPVFAGR